MNTAVKFTIFNIIIASFILTGIPMAAADEVAELKALVNTLLNRVDELEKKVDMYEAKEQSNERKVMHVEKQIAQVQHDLDDVSSSPTSLLGSDHGIDIGLGLTTTYMFTKDANQNNKEDVNDTTWSLDLELSKEFDSGMAYMLLEAGQGAGVDDELTTFSATNFDATGGNASLEMVEAWYEHYSGDLTLTFGKLDGTIYIDTNEYANDEAGQFLGSMFRNNPAIAFPDNGAGMRLAYSLTESIDIDALFMDGDGNWEDVADKAFYAGQVNIQPGLFDRAGNYRFYAWGSNQNHVKYSDNNSDDNKNYGLGLSFDQELTDIIGVFVRYGYQDEEVFSDSGAAGFTSGTDFTIAHSYSFGAQLAGSAWGRDDDAFGIAFGQNIVSDDYKDFNTTLNGEDESHFEAYYNFVVNDHLTVSPILHVVFDPFGEDAAGGTDTIIIGGLRSQVDF